MQDACVALARQAAATTAAETGAWHALSEKGVAGLGLACDGVPKEAKATPVKVQPAGAVSVIWPFSPVLALTGAHGMTPVTIWKSTW